MLLPASLTLLRLAIPARTWLGPWWGPHVTQLLHAYPLALLSGAIAARSLGFMEPTMARGPRAVYAGLLMALGWQVAQRLDIIHTCTAVTNLTYVVLGGSILVHLISLDPTTPSATASSPSPATASTSGTSAPAQASQGLRAKLQLYRLIPQAMAALLLARTLLVEPICHSGLIPGYHDQGPIKVLDRVESVTGWISVIDNTEQGYLALRAGDSLIGGRWKKPRDSVFLIFYAMEGVRLIKNRKLNDHTVARERGLQIGLGVGICTDSLERLGVPMDVVEIDPAVYDYARRYFGLVKPHGVHIMDGRHFIEHVAEDNTYDHIFHDVFTGGSVPAPLFSVEALQQLKRILKPDGVLSLVGGYATNHSEGRGQMWAYPRLFCMVSRLWVTVGGYLLSA
ncbi:S-adenosyl-L-methionine-dependent methyltransferase [Dimargaris cristalligena]|uniref:S-adenosyl-L-methionine-dependent methyltransferase n=1 Tax=Dimargaris cristalligena TaxID=215637 RepID=A0A4P9ZM23_9FUNG|nr:S-adenosyl-L-methionine-dependent methyltransferase [Dimargaris cristalligena]|eukprot:RKP34168.1 S-adenosyl-L-methionine-dependent methyltransferase [Dimargaris cristalligena]